MTNLTILHGDNLAASRTRRQSLINHFVSQSHAPTIIDATTITKSALESELTSINLFSPNFLVIDNLLSRLKSREKSDCIDLLVNNKLNKPVIMWDKKELTPTTLKPFLKLAQIEVFKAKNSIFLFLDAIKPNNQKELLSLFHRALLDNDIYLTFGMIARRITDLLIAKNDPSQLKGAIWTNKQIITQSNFFQEKELRVLHAKLLSLDLAIKTGNTKLDLISHLDILFLEL